MRNVKVAESPDWLKQRLSAIGLRPINNVVDITNYILHATGQPLHCFDLNRIAGGKVIVKPAVEGEKFVTLDEVERTLTSNDLMICNEKESMCIAGLALHAKNVLDGKSELKDMDDVAAALQVYSPKAAWNGASYTNAIQHGYQRHGLYILQ